MHPLLFQISLGSLGAFRVPAFGGLFALALLVAVFLTWRLAERAGLAGERVLGAVLPALFTGILAARLGFVLLHPSSVRSAAEALSLRSGGLSGPLGILVGALVLSWVGRRRGLPVPTLFDSAAPAFGAAVLLTRFGCWLEGCDFGKALAPSAPGWLVRLGTFPAQSHAWTEQVVTRVIAPSAAESLPVHPSELYESLAGLGLLVFALVLRRRQRAGGLTALATLVAYFVLRVLIDGSRPVSADVWCARVVLLAGLALLLALSVRRRLVSAPPR